MKKKIIAITLTLALVLSMGAVAFADTFSYPPLTGPEAGEGFSFEKNFEMDEDTNIPAATFSYSVAPGAAIDAGDGTAEVLAGVGTPTIADVVYEAGEEASADMTVTTENGVKTATKIAEVDFSDCEFTEPGIYRYIVTESGDNQGVVNDPIATRTLDVYVENGEGTEGTPAVLYTQDDVDAWALDNPDADPADCPFAVGDEKTPAVPGSRAGLKIAGYVFYEGTKTDAPSATAEEATGKSTGYTNEYKSYDLEFGKEVKGNFGSLDQYFEFTVVIGNLPEGTVLDVDLTDADATPHASDATKVTTAANPTQLTVGEDGTVTQKFYLHDGQYIKIKGLGLEATYAVTEVEHDYEKADGIEAADNDEGIAHMDPTSGTIGEKEGEITGYKNAQDEEITVAEYEELSDEGKLEYEPVRGDANQDVFTGFTNTKDVVTPAGIADMITSILPGIALVALAGAGIVLMSRKKREER